MTTIAATVDLRDMFGTARDQGPRPTCLAFATSDTHAALRGGWQPLSCEYIFYHAQRRGGRLPSQGATLSNVLEALRHDGQPEELGWPYLNQVPADLTKWIPPTSSSPLFRRRSESHPYLFDEMVAQIDKRIPIVALMQLSKSFFTPGPDGIVDEQVGELPNPNIRHAVVVVGYGIAGAQRVVLVRNSWGNKWAMGGYGWLTERFLRRRVYQLAILREAVVVSSGTPAA